MADDRMPSQQGEALSSPAVAAYLRLSYTTDTARGPVRSHYEGLWVNRQSPDSTSQRTVSLYSTTHHHLDQDQTTRNRLLRRERRYGVVFEPDSTDAMRDERDEYYDGEETPRATGFSDTDGFTNAMTVPRDSSGSQDSETTSLMTASETIENRHKTPIESFIDDDLADVTVDDAPRSPDTGGLGQALEHEHSVLGEGVESGVVNDQTSLKDGAMQENDHENSVVNDERGKDDKGGERASDLSRLSTSSTVQGAPVTQGVSGDTEEHNDYLVHYGTPTKDGYSVVNYDPPDSPSSSPFEHAGTLDIQDNTVGLQQQGPSPSPFTPKRAANNPAHTKDLLHNSPPFTERSRHLPKSKTNIGPDHAQANPDEPAYPAPTDATYIAIPTMVTLSHINSVYLSSLSKEEREVYLDSAIEQAFHNSKKFDIPFVIVKDSRSIITCADDEQFETFSSVDAFKKHMMGEPNKPVVSQSSSLTLDGAYDEPKSPSSLEKIRKKLGWGTPNDTDRSTLIPQSSSMMSTTSFQNEKAARTLGMGPDLLQQHNTFHEPAGIYQDSVVAIGGAEHTKSWSKTPLHNPFSGSVTKSSKEAGKSKKPDNNMRSKEGSPPPQKNTGSTSNSKAAVTKKSPGSQAMQQPSPALGPSFEELRRALCSNPPTEEERAYARGLTKEIEEKKRR